MGWNIWDYAGDYWDRYKKQIREGLPEIAGQNLFTAGGSALNALDPTGPLVDDALVQGGEKLADHQNMMYEAATGEPGTMTPEFGAKVLSAGMLFRPGGAKGLFDPQVLAKAKRRTVKFEPKTKGDKYVGTPYDMRNKQDLQVARNKMLDDVQQHAESGDADFYTAMGEWITQNIPDPAHREIFIRHLAYESSDNQATANAKLAVRTLNEYARAELEGRAPQYDEPTLVGGGRFPNQLAKYLPLAEDPNVPFDRDLHGVQRKVETFKSDIQRHAEPMSHSLWTDPELLRRSTHDRHMMQAYGWPGKTSATSPQYDYMENMTEDMARAISEASGEQVIPSQMQALQWGAKIRGEGVTPGSFADVAQSHMGNIPYEYTPDPASSAGTCLESQPIEVRSDYTDYMLDRFTDKNTGANVIYKVLGIPIHRQYRGYGFYNQQLQPGVMGMVASGETKIFGTWVQQSQNAQIAALATKYVFDQAAVPMYKLTKANKNLPSAIRINLMAPATEEFLNKYGAELVRALTALGVDAGDVGFSVVSPTEIDVVNFYGVDNQDFVRALDGIAGTIQEISSQDAFSSDKHGQYYGSDLSEESIEDELRSKLGPDTFRRLQSRRVEARSATDEFIQTLRKKNPLL